MACPTQQQGTLGIEKASGPSSRLAPPSLTPSQPALQVTVGMLNPPLPACGGASDHKPGAGGGEPPFTEVTQAPALRLEHLEKWVADAGPATSSWGPGLLSKALFPHPQGQNKTPLWEHVDSP